MACIQCIDCHPDVHITALSEQTEQMCSAACITSATISTGADNIGMIEYIYIYIPAMFAVTTLNAQLTYHQCTQVGVHSTVQRTNRF